MRRARWLLAGGLVAGMAEILPAAAPAATAPHVPSSIDADYEAQVETYYTTQFPSRWTNQPVGTAYRTSHDAAARWLRDEWGRLLKPFKAEGAFSELRPFDLADPIGTGPGDPTGLTG